MSGKLSTEKQSGSFHQGHDFMKLFPPELSNTLLDYVPDIDLFSCCGVSILWRHILNNDQQWSKRCLKRDWTTKLTLNEAFTWESLSHVPRNDHISFRPSPKFSLNESASSNKSRLSPLCEWAVYYRQRQHVHKNWSHGIYVVQELVAPESETESLIINSASHNKKYFAIGTTLGFVFIWNVSGVPELSMTLEPVQRNVEVEKVILTVSHLILLYASGVVRVFEEVEKSAMTLQQPFHPIYQTKIYFNFLSEMCDMPPFQLEVVTKRDVTSLLKNCPATDERNDIAEMKMWNEIFLSQFEKLETEQENDDTLLGDILMFANEESVFLTTQNCGSYIVWDLHSGIQRYIQLLSPSYQVFQMTLSGPWAVISVQSCDEALAFMKYGILVYGDSNSTRIETAAMAPRLDFVSPKIIDEMSTERIGKRLAMLSQEGIVAAYHLTQKELIFVQQIESCIDNLTTSEDLMFYHNCEDRTIIALSWTGVVSYVITERLIGPVKKMCCYGPYLVSGGSVRELIVWEKSSGKKLHTVHHQPSYIIDMFVTPTSILTVGKDDPPAMIGYL